MAEISYEIIQYNTARQNYALFLTEHKLPSVLYSWDWERNCGSFVGFSRLPITETPPRMAQHCSSCCCLTWSDICSPDTCHLPRKQPSRTSVSGLPQARVSYGGMCPGRGQMSQYRRRRGPTTADCTEPAPRPPLLLRPPPCQQTHTAFSHSRPGSPCRGCCRQPTAYPLPSANRIEPKPAT